MKAVIGICIPCYIWHKANQDCQSEVDICRSFCQCWAFCRDYTDHPDGFVYELAGESVVPGIDAQNLESIFEEHILCSHLDPLVPQHNVFATAERKFDFGAVLAAVGGLTPQSGVKANLKFTNPHKVIHHQHPLTSNLHDQVTHVATMPSV